MAWYIIHSIIFLGIEENSPLGKDWSTVDAEPMKHVSYKKI